MCTVLKLVFKPINDIAHHTTQLRNTSKTNDEKFENVRIALLDGTLKIKNS